MDANYVGSTAIPNMFGVMNGWGGDDNPSGLQTNPSYTNVALNKLTYQKTTTSGISNKAVDGDLFIIFFLKCQKTCFTNTTVWF